MHLLTTAHSTGGTPTSHLPTVTGLLLCTTTLGVKARHGDLVKSKSDGYTRRSDYKMAMIIPDVKSEGFKPEPGGSATTFQWEQWVEKSLLLFQGGT